MRNRVLFTFIAVMFSLTSQASAGDSKALKFYGKAVLSVDRLYNGDDARLFLSSNSSRFGVKGEIPVEGTSLTAIYQIESGVNFDESGKEFATRNSFLGIKGAFGKIFGGYHDTPFKRAGHFTNRFFIDQVGDYRNVMGEGAKVWHRRESNIIIFSSPEFVGTTVNIGYKPEEDKDFEDLVSGNIKFKMKGARLVAAYETHGKGLTDAAAKRETGVRFGGAYTIAGFTAEVSYEALSHVGGVSGKADKRTFGSGLGYAFKKFTAKGAFFTTKGIETDTSKDVGAIMVALGLDYDFSKKTKVYLNFASTDNEHGSKLRVSGGGHGDKVTPATGRNSSGLSLGLIQKF